MLRSWYFLMYLFPYLVPLPHFSLISQKCLASSSKEEGTQDFHKSHNVNFTYVLCLQLWFRVKALRCSFVYYNLEFPFPSKFFGSSKYSVVSYAKAPNQEQEMVLLLFIAAYTPRNTRRLVYSYSGAEVAEKLLLRWWRYSRP